MLTNTGSIASTTGNLMSSDEFRFTLIFHQVLSWRSGYCYLNKGKCNVNQSKDDSFAERVAKNNR